MNVALLHLCDSLFPIGAFAHSDGLEAATADGRIASADDLGEWLAVCLDESIGRLEGPAVWHAWRAARDGDAAALAALDEELTAMRPSSAARRSSRAMGRRLLTTWRALHPSGARAFDGSRDILQGFARTRRADSGVKRVTRCAHELHRAVGHFSDGKGDGAVAIVTFIDEPEIDADDVAVFELPRRRNAVHDLLVH